MSEIILPNNEIITPSDIKENHIILPNGSYTGDNGERLAQIDLVSGGAFGTSKLNLIESPSDDIMAAANFKNPRQLEELKYIIKDVLSGDPDAARDERFSYLNFKQVKTAIEWILTNNFDDTLQQLLLESPWLLTFKNKPPTPEGFLTHKYIGSMADSVWLPVRKNFVQYFDPLKPHRNAVLNMSIGAGKKLTITTPVLVDEEDYYEFTDDSGKVFEFLPDQKIWHDGVIWDNIESLIDSGKPIIVLDEINNLCSRIYEVEKTGLFDEAFGIEKYDELISYFKKNINDDVYYQWNIYTNEHHIIPKCEGGSDSRDNLIKLPYYFHILAHYLRGKEAEANDNISIASKNYKAVIKTLNESSIPKDVIELHGKLKIVVDALEKENLSIDAN